MTEFTRRDLLSTATALAATGIAGPAFAGNAAPGLNALAARRGLRFGSCFSWGEPGSDTGSFANPDYAALLTRDCGLLVPENELKWQRVRPSPKVFDFARFDAMLAWAESKRLAMRGHTLFWAKTQYIPDWLNSYDYGANPAKEADRLLTEHISTICRRYGKRVTAYDVVNEAVDEKTAGLRESSITKAFGGAEAMIDHAFHVARDAAPHAQLVYNEYMSWEPGNEIHRAGVLKLLEGFRKRNVPVDALGVQSHISLIGEGTPGQLATRQEKPWREFLDAVVAMGYKLVVTEMDISDKGLPTDLAQRDAMVADYGAAYLEIMLSYPQLHDVLFWGMCDKYSWLNHFKPRADGTLKRGTPYDATYKPKPLYTAVGKRLSDAPARSA
ncbi:endo-1,4-beta-xylanase [Sphingomonas sp. JC676]|uniref:endo-1,4-beta-xylanase n=1 Tax=Sphingomonas sp. JC676 TaxID=2768065 RepID=UPI0016581C1D|nr:endo-1,4-beta-xylanase [Sphingomonas sp. JC676]MBC9032606.1 endo-1,4-beta-xylanase [Sphingomonas sp. JC676]